MPVIPLYEGTEKKKLKSSKKSRKELYTVEAKKKAFKKNKNLRKIANRTKNRNRRK